MTKWRSIPSALPSRWRMRTPMAWKVPIQIAPAARLRRFSTRLRISRAALLVNVTARISPGSARPCWISQAIRCVSTRVLPLPAPAKISSGPSSAVTAARCGGFSPAKRSIARSAAGEEDKVNARSVYRAKLDQKRIRRDRATRPAGSLVAAAAAAHPAGGHVVHVVVVRGVPLLPRCLERLRERADELITQLHRGDLERVLQRPVVVRRVLALARPEQEGDQLHLDLGHELRVALRLAGPILALSLGARGGRRWGDGAIAGADGPGRRARSGRNGRRLRDQAGAQ